MTIAHELKDQGLEATTLDALGFVSYFGKNDLPQAIAYHEQSLALYRQIKSRAGEMLQLMRLGLIYMEDAQDARSLLYYEPALVMARELKDPREVAILNRLGQIYHALYGVDKAIETY